ncbi:MAG: ATP synthase subunit I [Clostridia bacterium]|nr:ATP synthase subunit I [Clostridia bacterium]
MTKETWTNILKVSLGISLLSAAITAIVAFTPYFDYTVATGALLGTLGAALNFTFLGFVVSKAVEKDEKNAQHYVQASYTARLLFMAAVIIIGIKLPYFNGYMTIVPFLLIRPVVMIVNFISRKKSGSQAVSENNTED